MNKCKNWFVCLCVTVSFASHADVKTIKIFYFGQETPPQGSVKITTGIQYSTDLGYGWLKENPNMFAVELPEGNYNVSVAYNNPELAASTTVKSENRRLMLMKQEKADGLVRCFTANIRRPGVKGGDKVRLHDRELPPNAFLWDDLLTLEFLPDPEGVKSITIEPLPEAATVYIAGDSTVTDQAHEPWCGWGQMLPCFFGPGLAVANHAESGRALFSFRSEKRLAKIISSIRPGDYLFVQFGHNDQKNKKEGAGPFTTYKKDLEDYVNAARSKGANPVLVTPMERRRWSGGKPGETLTDFAEAVRMVGREQKVPVLDLHAMSLKLYAALGEEGSKRAFVYFSANSFPGQNKALSDNTHHCTYGAYELARCVVEEIRKNLPELAKHLRADTGTFDPSRPDDLEKLGIPPSVAAKVETPEGDVALRVSVAECGAVADGKTLNTKAIQSAIDKVAVNGGGIVVVPEGVFVSGALFLKPGVNLHLEKGSEIRCSTDLSNFPPQRTRIEGHFEDSFNPALINAENCDGLRITGEGTLNGAGKPVWDLFWSKRNAAKDKHNFKNLSIARARLCIIGNSKDVVVSGITFKDSQFWNLHLYKCQDVKVDGVSFMTPDGERPPSSDGVDIDSCQGVEVKECYFAVNDDCIALKGTKGPFALEDKTSPPVERIRVSDCTFKRGHGLVTCGSEATIVRDVIVEDCKVEGSMPIVRFKLRPDTPQCYEDFIYRNISMENSSANIFEVKKWTQYFDLQGQTEPVSHVRNIRISGIKGSIGSLGVIQGNNMTEFGNITLENVDVKAKKTSLDLDKRIKNMILKNVNVNGEEFKIGE